MGAWPAALALLAWLAGAAAAASGQPAASPPRLSHHVLCEPLGQLHELRLRCNQPDQFIVVLEAYYSDLYADQVCARAQASEQRLARLTGSQLVAIFRQLYAYQAPGTSAFYSSLQAANSSAGTVGSHSNNNNNNNNQNQDQNHNKLRFNPTLTYGSARPFCLDDLRESLRAKCSGRPACRFSRHLDHEFPHCAKLKPGHVFARYLCVDDSLLLKYCNADARLASHSSAANRVRRRKRQAPPPPAPLAPPDEPAGRQLDTRDFGFVATPGYPNFYATPRDCGWTLEAELNQRITVKLLDASLAPSGRARPAANRDYSTSNSLFPSYDTSAEPLPAAADQPEAANLLQDGPSGNGSARTVFKIDPFDYEAIRSQVAQKLQQVAEQCEGYDQLLVRDSDQARAGWRQPDQLELIARLPVALYEHRLIDFANKSIYSKQQALGAAEGRRIDYQALLGALNPLQLSWLYAHNVTLCSIAQQEQLSAPLEKNKISFTSSANTMRLELSAGRVFNPTNRGLLFWYHKHGCPASTRTPTRARLLLRNETTEIFQCFHGFVFNDTRSSVRVRTCSPELQLWLEEGAGSAPQHQQQAASEPDQFWLAEGQPRPVAPCVYLDELANGPASAPAAQPEASQFERLIAATANAISSVVVSAVPGQAGPMKLQAPAPTSAGDTALEVVGAAAAAKPPNEAELARQMHQQQQQQVHNQQLLGLANVSQLEGATVEQSGLAHALGFDRLWPAIVDYVIEPVSGAGGPAAKGISTHELLREHRPAGSSSSSSPSSPSQSLSSLSTTATNASLAAQGSSLWSRAGNLLDRRLLAPAFIVLLLFIVMNFIIYVIFLVALPKFARLVLGRRPRHSRQQHAKQNHHNYYNTDTTRSSLLSPSSNGALAGGPTLSACSIKTPTSGPDAKRKSSLGKHHSSHYYDSDYQSANMGVSL